MSTYEDEHNIREETSQETQTNTNTRTHQTLSALLQDFFESSISTTSVSPESVQTHQFERAISALGDIPLRDQLLEQLSTQKNIKGVTQEYIDSLDRVPKKLIKPDQTCSICTNDFLDDPHPLVVRLPCEGKHKFDLDCIAPWLKVHSTCPLCRKDVLEKKFVNLPEDSEEEEEDRDMYG